MAKIILTRIDNRLVHGQVGIIWPASLNVDTIVVVDDETMTNLFSQKLMTNVAKSSNIDISFYSIQQFIDRYFEVKTKQKLFVVVKTPKVAQQLHEANIPIDKVNLGNMHYARNKKMITKKVYMDEEDSKSLYYLLEKDVTIFYQDVPGSLKEKITKKDLSIEGEF